MTVIKNGANGDTLIINSEGQAEVQAEIQAQAAHHTLDGNCFIVQSSFIASSATADTTSAMLYLKNTSTTKDVYIGILRTCGEVPLKWTMKTGATGLSTENAIAVKNTLVGSPITADMTVYSGAQDATVTGGDVFTTWINGGGHSAPDFKGAIVLQANQSMSLECAPFASVSGEACISIEAWQI